MSCYKINGHPLPKRDESYRGYLFRLVDLNGFKSIRTIIRKLEFSPILLKLDVSNEGVTYFLNELEPALNMKSGQLVSIFDQHWTTKVYRSERSALHGLFHKSCRLCPLCLAENKYYNADWDFALTTHCAKHQCYLIDRCPHCNEAINWSGSYIDECPDCAESYTDTDVEMLPENCPLTLPDKLLKTRNHFSIEKLVTLCNWVHRLGDNMSTAVHLDEMPLKELIPLLFKAASMKYSASYREGYVSWLKQTRHACEYVSSLAVVEPFQALQASFAPRYFCNKQEVEFSPHLTNDVSKILIETIGKPKQLADSVGVQPSRIVNTREGLEVIDLNQQIDSHRLAVILHIPHLSIKSLVSKGVLNPTNGIYKLKHYIFDLIEVANYLKSLAREPTSQTNLITLREFIKSDKAASFSLPTHAAIELVLKQKVPFYTNSESNEFLKQYVDESFLLKALYQSLIDIPKCKTIVDLATIFHTSTDNVIELYELGYINVNNFWQTQNSVTRTIDEYSFANILKNYLSINRYCYLSGEKVTEINKLLAKEGVTPLTIKSCGSHPLYLYKVEDIPEQYLRGDLT